MPLQVSLVSIAKVFESGYVLHCLMNNVSADMNDVSADYHFEMFANMTQKSNIGSHPKNIV